MLLGVLSVRLIIVTDREPLRPTRMPALMITPKASQRSCAPMPARMSTAPKASTS